MLGRNTGKPGNSASRPPANASYASVAAGLGTNGDNNRRFAVAARRFVPTAKSAGVPPSSGVSTPPPSAAAPREESRRHQLRRHPPDSLGYLPPCQHHRRSLQEKPRQQRPSRRPPLISRSRLHKGKPAGEAPLSGPPACLLLRLRTRSLAKPVFSPIPQLIGGRISPNPLLPYQVVPSRSDGQSNLTDSGPPSTSKLTVLYKMWCSSLRQD